MLIATQPSGGVQQMQKKLHYFGFLVLFSFLAACSSTQLYPLPLFADKDLEQAILTTTHVLSTPINPQSIELNLSNSLPNISGFLYHSFFKSSFQEPSGIIINNLSSKTKLNLYQGKREIRSLTGNSEGTIVLASMLNTYTDPNTIELFKFDLVNSRITLLHSGDISEQTVTMSSNGDIIAWEDKEDIVINMYSNLKDNVLSDTVTLSNSKYPSLNYSGTHLLYMRQKDNHFSIYSYSLSEKVAALIASGSGVASLPSMSDDGRKLVWLEQGTSGYKIQFKNLPANLTYTLTTNSTGLDSPYITSDGKWLSYSQKIDGKWQLRIRNLATVQEIAFISATDNQHIVWQTKTQSCSREPSKKPNFIVILTDDQPYSTMQYMPYARADLANQGATFTNAFLSTPLCCPSRASILRGQFSHNHGVITNDPPMGGFHKFYELGLEQSTLATWMDNAGYATALVGKYLNRFPGIDEASQLSQKHISHLGGMSFTPLYSQFLTFTLE